MNDEGKPEVRIIDVRIVGQDKRYFCTGRGKDFDYAAGIEFEETCGDAATRMDELVSR